MNASKPQVAIALLHRNSTIFVHLDPRKPGVVLPAYLMRHSQVVLQLGFNMVVPILNLILTEENFSGVFSFKGKKEECVVPWSSVFAVVGEDAKGAVWGPDVPPELAAHLVDRSSTSEKPPAMIYDARESFENRRIDAAIERNFDGPSEKSPAKVVSLADFRARRAKGPRGAA